MKALILCDIDGCLNSGKYSPLDVQTLSSIQQRVRQLREADIGFTLCTGRPQPYAEAICRLLDIDLPIICENGSMLFFPKTDTTHPLIKKADVKKVLALKTGKVIEGWITAGLIMEPGKEFSISLTGPKLVNGDTQFIEKMVGEIRATIPESVYEVTYSSSSIDVTLKGINKGSAIHSLTKALDADLTSPIFLIGIGDSVADMSFLKKMDLVLSPTNANEVVQNASHLVSKQRYAKGILELIVSDEVESRLSMH